MLPFSHFLANQLWKGDDRYTQGCGKIPTSQYIQNFKFPAKLNDELLTPIEGTTRSCSHLFETSALEGNHSHNHALANDFFMFI